MPNFFDHFAVNSSKRTCNNGLGLLSINASGLNMFYDFRNKIKALS